jgi:hypothetical protein
VTSDEDVLLTLIGYRFCQLFLFSLGRVATKKLVAALDAIYLFSYSAWSVLARVYRTNPHAIQLTGN